MRSVYQLPKKQECFTRLLMNHTLHLSEELSLEYPWDFVYLSDIDTYELLYLNINSVGKNRADRFRDYRGKPCYEVLMGRNTPCPDCPNTLMREGQYVFTEAFEPLIGKNYLFKNRVATYGARKLRIGLALNISDERKKEDVLLECLQMQSVMIECVRIMMTESHTPEAFIKVMRLAGVFYGAERGYLHRFSESPDQPGTEVARWCARGERESALIGSPTQKDVELWSRMVRPGQQMVLRNVETLRSVQSDDYRTLRKEKVMSCCATPILQENKLIGFITFENVSRRWKDLSMLKLISCYIAERMEQQKEHEDSQRALYTDPITGKNNAAGYRTQASELLQQRGKRKYALWIGDIRHFKYINDVFGYDVGNRVLGHWAQVIEQLSRTHETFARLSADQFAALWWYEQEKEICERLRMAAELTADYWETAARGVRPEIYAGIYFVDPQDPKTLEEMLNCAMMALRSAKNKPGGCYTVFSTEMHSQMMHYRQLEEELYKAIGSGDLVLFLQPQIPLQNQQQLARAQVVVRWNRADQTAQMPESFRKLFGANSRSAELDTYIFLRICRYLGQDRADHTRPLFLSVYVSRAGALQPDFVESYTRIKEAYAIPDGTIGLEFSSEVVCEAPGQMEKAIRELRCRGFHCTVDGSGEEGGVPLQIIKKIPIDSIKIGYSFFEVETDTARRDVVLEGLLKITRQLGILTVAQLGKEQDVDAEMLRRIGCDFAQGDAFSPPLKTPEYEKWLQKGGFETALDR